MTDIGHSSSNSSELVISQIGTSPKPVLFHILILSTAYFMLTKMLLNNNQHVDYCAAASLSARSTMQLHTNVVYLCTTC
jgi:hypothetical protein